MFVFTAFLCVTTSCSKDDDDFAYPIEQLYGRWKATEINVGGTWYNAEEFFDTEYGWDITFFENGTFYASAYWAIGISGTYKTSGNTITTYVDGNVYLVYIVNSLSGNTVVLTLREGTESMLIKAKKQN